MRRDEGETQSSPALHPEGMRRVSAFRIPAAGQPMVEEQCWVMEERALFLDVEQVGLYTLMWTPTEVADAAGFTAGDGILGDTQTPEALALCAGFLLTESMIDSMSDVDTLAFCPDASNMVRVRLADPSRVRGNRRGGLVASSCGVCGGVDQEGDLQAGLATVSDTLRIHPDRFQSLMGDMQGRQTVFNITGGTHAAAIFSREAELVASAEDLGRHNALDKVIGQCLLRELPTAGCGVMLSGRVSLELVVKAARAGIELVAAVSAPSSLAVDAADRLGITLCGFVRKDRATVFTHPHRLR